MRLTPELFFDTDKVKVSSSGKVLTIQANALQYDTEYKIDVKIYRTQSLVLAPGQQVFYFKTGEKPVERAIVVNPSFPEFGVMFRR